MPQIFTPTPPYIMPKAEEFPGFDRAEYNPTKRTIDISIPVPDSYLSPTIMQTMKAASFAVAYLELFLKKQESYGIGNIDEFGELGVLVRANDKVKRLKQLIYEKSSNDLESIEDTWMDLMGYGLIGWMVHAGKWRN